MPTVDHGEASGGSGASAFEAAADAIVAGDLAALERLLRADPTLVRARSSREHRATLLHHVAANGVEDHLQRTPPNVLDVARHLLDAGAEVDAEADMYGGGVTTLDLVITSAHPRAAGVQLPLAELLLARGAHIGPRSVRACLVNGCPEAAAYIASLGGPLDLDEAAGIGRADLVAERLQEVGTPGGPAWRETTGPAMMMAAWYGREAVVTLLLDRGFDPAWIVGDHGDGRTALHLAAYEGHVAIVEQLLRRGAPVDAIDEVFGTTPLVWALHAWLVERRMPDDRHHTVVRTLAAAGATVKREWIDDDRVRADRQLWGLLRERASPGH